MTLFEKLLRRFVPFKEIGWEDIGEKFTRYALIKNRWFALYLHQLDCLKWHPNCHDHPWSFCTLLIWPGYLEESGVGANYGIRWRKPGTVLYRPAEFSHNVVTPEGQSWSLVLTGPKKREWGFKQCA